MIKIGFYGHSICSSSYPGTYIDEIKKHFNAEIVNKGTGRGSEERTLFQLKKTSPDVAVIFHSHPRFIFLSRYNSDIELQDAEDSVQRLITIKNFGFDGNTPTYWTEHEKIKYKLNSLPEAVELYKTHFYNPQVQMDRYLGTLMMIDHFCKNKVSATVHIPLAKVLPSWFNFQSGKVLVELSEIMYDREPGSPNGLSAENNELLKNKLIESIEKELENVSKPNGS